MTWSGCIYTTIVTTAGAYNLSFAQDLCCSDINGAATVVCDLWCLTVRLCALTRQRLMVLHQWEGGEGGRVERV